MMDIQSLMRTRLLNDVFGDPFAMIFDFGVEAPWDLAIMVAEIPRFGKWQYGY